MTFRKGLITLTPLYISLLLSAVQSADAQAARKTLHGQRPPIVGSLVPKSRMPGTERVYLAIGLPLRDQAAASDFLAQLYNPASPNFHKFITPQEFAERFAATENDYQAI